MPRGDGQPSGARRRGTHSSKGAPYVPKKLARRLTDETGINWSKIPGRVHVVNGYTWHKPGSQNPRK